MACDTRRGKMCAALAGVTGMTAAEQEQVYATANGQAAQQRAANTRTAAQDSLAELHARQMMDIYQEAGIAIPTHAKNGMPHRDTHAGHAAMRRTLQCPECGKFTGLAGCQNCAVAMGAPTHTPATGGWTATEIDPAVPSAETDLRAAQQHMASIDTQWNRILANPESTPHDVRTVTSDYRDAKDKLMYAEQQLRVATGNGADNADDDDYSDTYSNDDADDDQFVYTRRVEHGVNPQDVREDMEAHAAVRARAVQAGHNPDAVERALLPAPRDESRRLGKLHDQSPGGWQRLVVAAACVSEASTVITPADEAAILHVLERAQAAHPDMMQHVQCVTRGDTRYLLVDTAYGTMGTALRDPGVVFRADRWLGEHDETMRNPSTSVSLTPASVMVKNALADVPYVQALQYLDVQMGVWGEKQTAQSYSTAVANSQGMRALRTSAVFDTMVMAHAMRAANVMSAQLAYVQSTQAPQDQVADYPQRHAVATQSNAVWAQRSADAVCQSEQAWSNTVWTHLPKPTGWDGTTHGARNALLATTRLVGEAGSVLAAKTTALLTRYYGDDGAKEIMNQPGADIRHAYYAYTMAVAAEGCYGTTGAQRLCATDAWKQAMQRVSAPVPANPARHDPEATVIGHLENAMKMGVGEINARHVRHGQVTVDEEAYVAACAGVSHGTTVQDDSPSAAALLEMQRVTQRWMRPEYPNIPVPDDSTPQEAEAVTMVMRDRGRKAHAMLAKSLSMLPHRVTKAAFANDRFAVPRGLARGDEA